MLKASPALDDSTMYYPDFNFTLQLGFPGWRLWPQMTKFESSALYLLWGSQPHGGLKQCLGWILVPLEDGKLLFQYEV